jgi:hypothetical protein
LTIPTRARWLGGLFQPFRVLILRDIRQVGNVAVVAGKVKVVRALIKVSALRDHGASRRAGICLTYPACHMAQPFMSKMQICWDCREVAWSGKRVRLRFGLLGLRVPHFLPSPHVGLYTKYARLELTCPPLIAASEWCMQLATRDSYACATMAQDPENFGPSPRRCPPSPCSTVCHSKAQVA